MAKKAQKTKTAAKAKSPQMKRNGATRTAKAGRANPTATPKAAAKKASRAATTESRDALHNMHLDESSEFMHEHSRQPKRRNTRGKAAKNVDKPAKPVAIPIRQPQLHSEN